MQISPPRNGGGGKPARVLQAIEQSKHMVHGNDENVAMPPPLPPPSNPRPVQQSASNHDLSVANQDLSVAKQQQQQHQQRGKQLNRVAAIKAAGGRKGLSEQLKRARRFGEKGI